MSATYDHFYWEDLGSGVYRLRETPLATNYPNESDVVSGVLFGPENVYTGTFVPDYPLPADVRFGVVYADGTFVGELLSDCDYPEESEVLENVVYGYGAYTGTLEPGGTCDYPVPDDVREGVVYGDGVYTGTLIAGGSIPIAGDLQQKNIGYVHQVYAKPVIIKRGTVSTTTNAIPADHMIDYMSGDSVDMQSIDRVFRIRVDAYRFGGILATPQGSDVITWDGHDWEVIRRVNYAVPGYRNEYILPTKAKT